MIKVAISGADTPKAGELLRILVNHPDVDIVALLAPGQDGRQARFMHHGLLGETPLSFSSALPEKTDVLFVAEDKTNAPALGRLRHARPELKIIILSDIDHHNSDSLGMVYGLPEINRKSMVRGAITANVPSPIASLTLVPLFPLALNMLLNGDITLNISAPEDLVTPDNLEKSRKEINNQLRETQQSFKGDLKINILPPTSKRGIELTADLDCPVGLDDLLGVYSMYDDHNFAFAVTSPVRLDDVKGTEKCIASLSIPEEGKLRLHAVADGRLRGSAGEAVHIMNLMCGLHEKTGLALKPYAY